MTFVNANTDYHLILDVYLKSLPQGHGSLYKLSAGNREQRALQANAGAPENLQSASASNVMIPKKTIHSKGAVEIHNFWVSRDFPRPLRDQD